MMELKEQLIDDLNHKSFLYYPCCGMDFQIIPQFLEYSKIINEDRNFIFIDANNENTDGWFRPIKFLGNKIGLANLEIVDKKTYAFGAEFFLEFGEILNDFQQNDKDIIITFIKGIQNPKAIRFVLEYNNVQFILYYIYFEAVTIIKYINRFVLDTNSKGLLIKAPAGGWTEYELLTNNLISVSNPEYIVKCDNTILPKYGQPTLFPKSNNLWISFKKGFSINDLIFIKKVKAFNVLKFT